MIYNNIQFDVVLYRCYDFLQSIQETSCYMAVWVLVERKELCSLSSFHFNVFFF